MEQQLRADLLVIGGGFGGLFAAIQARKLGVRDVLIVDKGAVGLTGQSRMAAGATIFVHPGDDVEQWADAIFRGQNGLCNQDMVESFLASSTQRLREIESLAKQYARLVAEYQRVTGKKPRRMEPLLNGQIQQVADDFREAHVHPEQLQRLMDEAPPSSPQEPAPRSAPG